MSQGNAKNNSIGPTGATGPAGSTGPAGPAGPTGPAGSTLYSGYSTIDFGTSPGTNMVSVDVTGQTVISSTANIMAFMMSDTTVSGALGHNAIEHQMVPIRLTTGNISVGTGFTIYAETDWRLTSTFQVRWIWTQ